jgi:hypothetical protein
MLESFMKHFSKDMELEQPITSVVPGSYTIGLEEDLAVTIIEIPHGFSLDCTLCACPKGREEQFLTHALLGNLFGQGTKGAVLGLNLEGNEVKLTRTVDYHVEYKEFKDILEDFINSVDFWREEALNYR